MSDSDSDCSCPEEEYYVFDLPRPVSVQPNLSLHIQIQILYISFQLMLTTFPINRFTFRALGFLMNIVTWLTWVTIPSTHWVSFIYIAEDLVQVHECSHMLCFLSDEAVNRWSAIAPSTQRSAFKRMKMVTFWLPILLKPDKSSVSFTWAVKVGLVSSQ